MNKLTHHMNFLFLSIVYRQHHMNFYEFEKSHDHNFIGRLKIQTLKCETMKVDQIPVISRDAIRKRNVDFFFPFLSLKKNINMQNRDLNFRSFFMILITVYIQTKKAIEIQNAN
jgi:hypothetical protein